MLEEKRDRAAMGFKADEESPVKHTIPKIFSSVWQVVIGCLKGKVRKSSRSHA